MVGWPRQKPDIICSRSETMSDEPQFRDVEIEDPGKIRYRKGDRDVDAVARLDLLIIREAWNRGMDVEDLADGFAVASEIDPETGEERTVAGGLGTKGDWSRALNRSLQRTRQTLRRRASSPASLEVATRRW